MKKKKKKSNKKKKKVTQTEPPTIPVSKMFTNNIYPEGELCDYKEEYVDTSWSSGQFSNNAVPTHTAETNHFTFPPSLKELVENDKRGEARVGERKVRSV